jgi:hypothetical protein
MGYPQFLPVIHTCITGKKSERRTSIRCKSFYLAIVVG